jgi:hypothetical protein
MVSVSKVHNIFSPMPPSGPRGLDPSGTGPSIPEGEGQLDRTIQLLQRLNDRITALNALHEQQLRRLETLEYR